MNKKLSSCIFVFGVVFILAAVKTTSGQINGHKPNNPVINFQMSKVPNNGYGFHRVRYRPYESSWSERRSYDRDDYYRGDRDDRYRGDRDDRYERHRDRDGWYGEKHERSEKHHKRW